EYQQTRQGEYQKFQTVDVLVECLEMLFGLDKIPEDLVVVEKIEDPEDPDLFPVEKIEGPDLLIVEHAEVEKAVDEIDAVPVIV
ncbi:12019_t:CDS:1, partial [Racocetra persica]